MSTEKHGSICRAGILAKLNAVVLEHSGEVVDYEVLELVVKSMEKDDLDVFAALMEWARDEIAEAGKAYGDDQLINSIKGLYPG
jgi:hypothetical protein